MNAHDSYSSFTSLTLLGRVRDLSDQQAWDEFVQVYTPRIFSWCKQNLLQDQDASDVTQEVLMKLVTAMEKFEYQPTRGSFRGWLKTVTTNAVRDLARRRSSSELTGPSASEWLDKLTEPDSINELTEQ
ncbi:MAG: sigma-70 family RNA polymerase sigma factor, partial [Planctomycetota bacterium]